MKQLVDLKEIKIKIEPKIYPIGRKGNIITGDLLNTIADNLKAEKLINNNHKWTLDNMLIDKLYVIFQAFYDIANNEIILSLVERNKLACKYYLTDCIYCGHDCCENCIDGDEYDEECK